MTNQSTRFTPTTLKTFLRIYCTSAKVGLLGKVSFLNLAFQVITKLKIFVLIFACAFNKEEQPIATDNRNVKLNQLVMVTYTEGAETIDIKYVYAMSDKITRDVCSLVYQEDCIFSFRLYLERGNEVIHEQRRV